MVIPMLKSQDIIILLKLIANPQKDWSQRELSKILCISLAEINGGIKRLIEARLLRQDKSGQHFPILPSVEELLIYGLKYFFPAKLGEFTRGIPTGIGSPLFYNKIASGNDPIPVWPFALGEKQGVALNPIHFSVPKSLRQAPDPLFYELLAIIDVIRIGRVRERNIAIKLLKEKIKNEK